MEDIIRCNICGEPAEHFFGANESFPVCENFVCQQATLDEVNRLLRELSEEEQ